MRAQPTSRCLPPRSHAWLACPACLGPALPLVPADSALYNDLGAVLQQQWRLEEAADALQTALELQPRYAVAANNLAVTLHSAGQLREALHWYLTHTQQQ